MVLSKTGHNFSTLNTGELSLSNVAGRCFRDRRRRLFSNGLEGHEVMENPSFSDK